MTIYSNTTSQSVGSGTTSQSVNSALTGLSTGTTYYFRIAASNGSGTARGSVLSFTPALPPAPTDVSALAGYGEVTISWSPVVGATSYNIYYSKTSPVTKATGTKIVGGTSPNVVSGLTIDTTYYFVVTSENADGESALSSQVSAIPFAEYIAVGDSITFGTGDNISADGIGYEPILANSLGTTITNEGVPGVDSAYGASNISSTLSKYPSAKYFLVLYGTNDAYASGGPVSRATYKSNMQTIISAIKAAGKTPYLAKVPYTSNVLYSIPSIQEYNVVIDELVAENAIAVSPPDFYTLFQNNTSLLNADGLHPNGTGYQSMAAMWAGVLP
jgi:lysophospholipase L1-like esterase